MKILKASMGMVVAALSISIGLTGCGGSGSSGGGNNSSNNSLATAVYNSAPVSVCPNGGITVDAGIDTNGNGVLDTSEVSSTQYVCNGADGTNGTNGLNTLVSVADEAAGANCSTGGKKISTGSDVNGNNLLDAAEITSSNYICNGSSGSNGSSGTNGVNSLVSVTTEPAGANCTTGGSKVTSGLDTNTNSILDNAEVTGTQYVCNGNDGSNGTNGANGSNGTNGFSALLAVADEAAGANCAAGGKKVSVGLDTNGDNILDVAEITSSDYICNGANGTNGTNGTNGSNGLNSLTEVTVETAGANCANGGLKSTSGLDINANSVLDTGEITTTAYVCNGTNGTNGVNGNDGFNTLVSITSEPAGANCTNGGSKIRSGLDSNANAVLDTGEVSSTTYVCNGTDGPAGPGITWVNVTGPTQQAVSNTGYMANSASQVTITLPASPAVGDIIQVSGIGTGGWKIAQNAGQSIITNNVIGSIGATWIPRDAASNWYSVASSSDGTKLVAAVYNGQIYTSVDSGATWTARESARLWYDVASSSDGTKLVAAASNGNIYTSTDSGVTWTPRDAVGFYPSVASSSDGTKLVATVYGGQIYTSVDSGVTWTPRESARNWWEVASSSDGTKLVATVYIGQIYTSVDSGVTWTPRESARNWWEVASSSDGTKLVAIVKGGQIYTSVDSGVTWTARESARNWYAVASSSDGTKLVATVNGGQIYTSVDSGATWTARESARMWSSVASSADGTKLVATVNGGQIYTSVPTVIQSTTAGTAGSVSGGQYDTIELQCVGNGVFMVLSYMGYLVVQ